MLSRFADHQDRQKKFLKIYPPKFSNDHFFFSQFPPKCKNFRNLSFALHFLSIKQIQFIQPNFLPNNIFIVNYTRSLHSSGSDEKVESNLAGGPPGRSSWTADPLWSADHRLRTANVS